LQALLPLSVRVWIKDGIPGGHDHSSGDEAVVQGFWLDVATCFLVAAHDGFCWGMIFIKEAAILQDDTPVRRDAVPAGYLFRRTDG